LQHVEIARQPVNKHAHHAWVSLRALLEFIFQPKLTSDLVLRSFTKAHKKHEPDKGNLRVKLAHKVNPNAAVLYHQSGHTEKMKKAYDKFGVSGLPPHLLQDRASYRYFL
jgi:hypothetical protein